MYIHARTMCTHKTLLYEVPCALRLNIMYVPHYMFIYVAFVPIFVLLFVIRWVPFLQY